MPSDDALAAGVHVTPENNPANPHDLYHLEPAPEPITKEEEEKLRAEAIKFHQIYESFNSDFYGHSNFYVVSMKWLNRWKVYTSYE